MIGGMIEIIYKVELKLRYVANIYKFVLKSVYQNYWPILYFDI